MTEEQIKKIKDDLVKKTSKMTPINKATYMTAARELNMLFHKQGCTTVDEFIMLDDMLEIEVKINLIVCKI